MDDSKKEITTAFHITVKGLCSYLGYSITGLNKFCQGNSKNKTRAMKAVRKLEELSLNIYRQENERNRMAYKNRMAIIKKFKTVYKEK